MVFLLNFWGKNLFFWSNSVSKKKTCVHKPCNCRFPPNLLSLWRIWLKRWDPGCPATRSEWSRVWPKRRRETTCRERTSGSSRKSSRPWVEMMGSGMLSLCSFRQGDLFVVNLKESGGSWRGAKGGPGPSNFRNNQKSAFSTNAQSRFASVDLDGVCISGSNARDGDEGVTGRNGRE